VGLSGDPMRGDDQGFPGLLRSLWLVLAVWMAEMLCFALLSASGQFQRGETMQAWVTASVLGNGVVSAAFLSRQGLAYGDVFHPARASAGATLGLLWLPILLLVPAICLLAGTVQEALVALFPMNEWHRRMFTELIESGPASIAGLILVAPVLEELLFRGIILRGLLSRYKPWQAILASALIFGAAHMNLYQFVGAGLMGLVLGWLYLRFRSTFPCILLHGAYNGTLLMLSILGDNSGAEAFDIPAGVAWSIAFACALLGGTAIRYLGRRAHASVEPPSPA
jgi:uncharacterized protein